MKWAQFKDPVAHMCLAGTVVASWYLTQEVAGSSSFNNKYLFVIQFTEKLHLCRQQLASVIKSRLDRINRR